MLIRRMDMLFGLIPTTIHAGLFVSLINTAFLWNIIARDRLVIWFSSMAVITFLRDLTYLLYNKKGHRYLKQFYVANFIGMLLSALIWGLAGYYIFSPVPLDNFLIIITMLGIVIAGTTSLASDRRMMFTFITAIIGPLTLRVFLFGTTMYTIMGIFLLTFLLLILFVAFRVNSLIVSNLDFQETHMKMIDELTRSEARFHSIFEHAPSGIFYYDADMIIYECNEEFCSILEAPKDKLIGLDMRTLKDRRVLPALQKAIDGEIGTYEGYYSTTVSEIKLWISLKCSPMTDEQNNISGAVGIVQNRTEVHRIEEKVTHMAYHDSLTGLPNRLLLKDRIGQALLHAGRHNNYGAILFLDLDNFKKINDTLGHDVGDKMLIEVSKRITTLLRNEDTVSRVGGDEFVIVLPKLHETEKQSITGAGHVADKIHQVLTEPIEVMRRTMYTSTSIGIVLFSRSDGSIDKLLKNADTAMYEAKKEGRGTTYFFNAEMNRIMRKRLSMENDLRQAVSRGELIPYFQPIIHVGDERRICGAETLLRWLHPDMGMISPGVFIPLAEETGQILDIGQWLIGEVCRTLKQWIDGPAPDPDYISINISVIQLQQKDFASIILGKIEEYEIPPSMIVLEITENVLVGNFDRVSENIRILREKGILLALDDFGTGYSSLTYLKRLALDIIKIDRTFISDICEDRGDYSLVKAILNIARDFRFKVIAEGVEEENQLRTLREMECRYFQGYLFSRPLSSDEYIRFIEDFNS